MSNQVIGVAGVFLVTFFLLALRHLLLIWGQASKRRHISPGLPVNVVRETTKDDSWLPWPQDIDGGPENLAASKADARTPPDFGRRARSSFHNVK